ncbi:MAG: GHKL domain-containing protein [Bacilli bacterium]|nr:GHKL domain-containing protein [Bacilli bacterium]
MVVFVIIVSSLFVIIFILINKNQKSKFLLNKYEEIIKEERMVHHEYNNQLIVLSGFLECKKYDDTYSYLKTIINDFNMNKEIEIKELTRLPNGGIKKLLVNKILKMASSKINYNLNIYDSAVELINKIDLKKYISLTKILGILMDNSIDEAINTIEKKINIEITKDRNYLIFYISNSIRKQSDINKIGKNGYTTKGLRHGYGLKIIKGILKENPSIEVTTDIVENMYVQTVLVDLLFHMSEKLD